MANDGENGAKGYQGLLKIVTSALILVGSVGGGVWALDARYATKGETEKYLQLAEGKVTNTLDKYNMHNDLKFKQQDLKLMQLRSEFLSDQKYKLKQWLRQNPNDDDAKSDLQRIEADINDLKIKMEKSMEIK
jgi:hypothetical protein